MDSLFAFGNSGGNRVRQRQKISAVLFGAAKPFEIRLVIGATEKSLSSLVAAHDDVIEQTGGKQSGSAGHDWDL
jgi:hypothetical protein